MKKPVMGILVLLIAIFTSFTGGFFAGRQLNRAPIRIYQLPSPTVATAPVNTSPTEPLVVNINTATVQELEALPGIGPTLAQRIVDDREENGPFPAIESLIRVKGIGENKMEALLDLITVD